MYFLIAWKNLSNVLFAQICAGLFTHKCQQLKCSKHNCWQWQTVTWPCCSWILLKIFNMSNCLCYFRHLLASFFLQLPIKKILCIVKHIFQVQLWGQRLEEIFANHELKSWESRGIHPVSIEKQSICKNCLCNTILAIVVCFNTGHSYSLGNGNRYNTRRNENRSPSPIGRYQRTGSQSPPPSPVYNANDSGWDDEPRKISLHEISDSEAPNKKIKTEKPFWMGALCNFGNSCYLNAVLYALRFTPNFLHNLHHFQDNVNILLGGKHEEPDHLQSVCIQTVATGDMLLGLDLTVVLGKLNEHTVFEKLHEVFEKQTGLEMANISNDAIDASALQLAVQAINHDFEPRTQQDAHEFLMCVLNCLRDISNGLLEFVCEEPQFFQE